MICSSTNLQLPFAIVLLSRPSSRKELMKFLKACYKNKKGVKYCFGLYVIGHYCFQSSSHRTKLAVLGHRVE